MPRSFGLVDYKVLEAEYFLGQLEKEGNKYDFWAVQYNASAFASAARSVTFAMQSCLSDVDGFPDWYEEQQKKLKGNKLARFFHEFRRVTQHIGENVVGGGSSGPKKKALYYFHPVPEIREVPELDVVAACKQYFCDILEIVFLCYIRFGPIVDGQQRYTEQHFHSIGKTIEDAEEELGFPRGHTDIRQPATDPWRWQMLRRCADGCQIEQQFYDWLKKELPREAPPPPFQT